MRCRSLSRPRHHGRATGPSTRPQCPTARRLGTPATSAASSALRPAGAAGGAVAISRLIATWTSAGGLELVLCSAGEEEPATPPGQVECAPQRVSSVGTPVGTAQSSAELDQRAGLLEVGVRGRRRSAQGRPRRARTVADRGGVGSERPPAVFEDVRAAFRRVEGGVLGGSRQAAAQYLDRARASETIERRPPRRRPA
jgi:hypothetical protein